MSERFKELVLKTSDRATDRGFESHSLRQKEDHPMGGLLFGLVGFERPLRKHASGMFLGRGRVLWFPDTSGTDVDGNQTFLCSIAGLDGGNTLI